MTKRKLSESEVKLCMQSICRIKEEILDLEFLSEYQKLMLDKGIEREVKAKIKATEEKYKESVNQLTASKKQIEILEDQIKNGVEKKEQVPEKKQNDKEEREYIG